MVDNDRFDLEPNLTYADSIPGARIAAQGIDCTLTSTMLELAIHHGGLSLEKDIPHQDIEQLYGAVLGQPIRVTIDVEPIDELGAE